MEYYVQYVIKIIRKSAENQVQVKCFIRIQASMCLDLQLISEIESRIVAVVQLHMSKDNWEDVIYYYLMKGSIKILKMKIMSWWNLFSCISLHVC